MSGYDGESVAFNVLYASTPESWHKTMHEEGCAHDALHYVLNEFDGGANELYVGELDREFRDLKMDSKETVDDDVMNAANLALNLKSIGRPVTHTSLVAKIVNGLTDMYAFSKPGLRIHGEHLTVRNLLLLIKSEGHNLEVTRPKAKALVAQFSSGTTGDQGRFGTKGEDQPRKCLGICWNCGEQGHMHRDCQEPDSNFAFRPPRENGGAGAREAPKALITISHGGKPRSWADMVDGQEWVVGSGSSDHLTGNPGVLHDYVKFAVPRPLGNPVSTEAAWVVGEGTVCMEGTNETTFWLKDVGFVPGLSQNLFSLVAGTRQKLALTVNSEGEFASVNQTGGKSLCDVLRTSSQYLLDARALEGGCKRTYHAMLDREGRTIDVAALLTLSEDSSICELWHRRMGHPSPQALNRLVREQMAEGKSIPAALLKQAIKCRCECCILGKMTHLPFPLSESKKKNYISPARGG